MLAQLLNREREVELAKLDYVCYGLLTCIESSGPKIFEQKLEALTKIRKATVEVLTGEAYNPIILYQRLKENEQKKINDSVLLNRLTDFNVD